MRHYACGSPEHEIARRQFLGTAAAGLGALAGVGALARPAAAEHLAAQQKRVMVIDLRGGASQLETWDPKPGTDTGGPFRTIPTSVPGLHICELLPHTAKQMHRLAVVRSINTRENDHGKGRYAMLTGRRRDTPGDFPYIGAVAAKALAPVENPLPGHIQITYGNDSGRSNDAAYLGPRYASITLGDGKPPANTSPSEAVSAEADALRQDFRRRANDRFSLRRHTAQTDLYTYNYEQALQLMERREIFDVAKEPEKDLERYGKHDFGRHLLLGRRLLENGITFVQVAHGNYDTHHENFNFHLEQLGEFDRSFATLIEDLVDRGMLESTLVVVLSEFGRTPRINHNLGRDHWGTAWSIVLGGCGIQAGAVLGKTNANGTAVTEREVNQGHLFHTYLTAVGLDPTSSFDIAGRPMPLADPAASAIKELLA